MARLNTTKVCCTFCKVEIFRTRSQVEAFSIFFCSKDCKNKAQAIESGISEDARVLPEEPDTKIRSCLGWCGKKFRTTRYKRFCDSCGNRSRYASSGIDANEYSLLPSHD